MDGPLAFSVISAEANVASRSQQAISAYTPSIIFRPLREIVIRRFGSALQGPLSRISQDVATCHLTPRRVQVLSKSPAESSAPEISWPRLLIPRDSVPLAVRHDQYTCASVCCARAGQDSTAKATKQQARLTCRLTRNRTHKRAICFAPNVGLK